MLFFPMLKTNIRKLSTYKLENFGVSYLKMLQQKSLSLPLTGSLSDHELVRKSRWYTYRGIALSVLAGFVSAFLSVYADLHLSSYSLTYHYGWWGLITLVVTVVEFYFLFIIALRTVYDIANLSHSQFANEVFTESGPFNIINILARAAMELPDPPIRVLDIDPFKKISRPKLIIAGILYKLKILLSNVVVRLSLQRVAGKSIMRISVPYVAVPITGMWNAFILFKVAKEARLRIFGNILAANISKKLVDDQLIHRLSPLARIGCLRAIANAVVLTQNYHPNMIILLLRFKELLGIEEPDNYDDWNLFLEVLDQVNEEERYTILDILTIAAAFDGKISSLERKHLKEAYKEYSELYFNRLERLTYMLTKGYLHEAIALCEIDGQPG
ncbi:MAG: hypothetical protein MUF42_07095 [Cytophagaceae bacterium]|jgi:hypothetical protein|nr:hypothetical protein [Cytophagaceae bacterium]